MSSFEQSGSYSGGLHVAWMTGMRAVAWFRQYEGLPDWQPLGPEHFAFVGVRSGRGISGIYTTALLNSCTKLLDRITDSGR